MDSPRSTQVAVGSLGGRRLEPSGQQSRLLSAVASGLRRCVVIASAGSGKTTLLLLLAQRLAPEACLLLTYNRALVDETSERATAEGVINLKAKTFHSLAGQILGRTVYDDIDLMRFLASPEGDANNLKWSAALSQYSWLFVDEVQDLRLGTTAPFLERLLSGRFARAVVVGDPMQLLYDFPSLGKNVATLKFLRPTGDWRRFKMNESFRLTPQNARFVNSVCRTNIRGLGSPGPAPVLWRGNVFSGELMLFVERELEHYGVERSMILAPCLKEGPVIALANRLMYRGTPVSVNQGEIKDGPEERRGKLLFATFCASKGLERDLVVVFDFQAQGRRTPGLRQMHVALTRARRKLVVLQNTLRACALYPVGGPHLDQDVLEMRVSAAERLVESLALDGALTVVGHAVSCSQGTPPLVPKALCASALTHLDPEVLLRLYETSGSGTSQGFSSRLRLQSVSAGNLRYKMERLYGVAVVLCAEFLVQGKASASLELLFSPLPLNRASYESASALLAHLDEAFPKLGRSLSREIRLQLEEVFGEKPRTAIESSELLEQCLMTREAQEAYEIYWTEARRPKDRFLRADAMRALRLARSRAFGERATVGARADEWLLLAAALTDLGQYHDRLSVIKRARNSWAKSEVLEEACKRTAAFIGSKGQFEVPVSFELESTPAASVLGISGRADWISDDGCVVEVKFANGSITSEHKQQALVYAAMRAVETERLSPCSVFNARSGESWNHTGVCPGDAKAFLTAICRLKEG